VPNPHADPTHRLNVLEWDDEAVQKQVEIEKIYWGYMKRERADIAKFRRLESRRIPPHFDYTRLQGLLLEAKQKFTKIQPQSIAQAARIPGVTPSDINVLLVYLERSRGT